MPVTTQHPEYMQNVMDWIVIENVLQGRVHPYVPDINMIYPRGHDLAGENWHRRRANDIYRHSGRFCNFSLQTLNAIVGLATNCPPKTMTLPPELEYLEDCATGDQNSLQQLIQDLVRGAVGTGRIGLFTDFPTVEEGKTAEQIAELKPRPYMYLFPASSIINWDTTSPNGVGLLSQVVIHKWVRQVNPLDRFSWKMVPQYLVLELDSEGYYTQSNYDAGGGVVPGTIENFKPKANGKWLRQIPFTFVGAQNNNAKCDVPPLKSIVELNIGHYRNSCIYEDNLKKYGRGTMYFTSGLPPDEWKDYLFNRPMVVGDESGYFLGQSGSLELLQLQPAQEAAVAMTQKEHQIAMLGGHIVLSNPTNISEQTTRLNMGDRISMLSAVVNNIEEALELHIRYCADFMGANSNIVDLELSTDFIKKAADPLVMQQLMTQFTGGVIPSSVVLDYDKSVGIIGDDQDYDELQSEIDQENPLGQDSPNGLDTPAVMPGTPVAKGQNNE